MDEFEAYYAGKSPDQTATQKTARQYGDALAGQDDEFSSYYKQQDEEKKKRMAANLARIQEKTKKLQGEADQATNPLAYAQAGTEGLATGVGDILDTATLGAYRRIRDYALEKASPDKGQALHDMEAGVHAPVTGNPLMRAAQITGNAANTAAGSLGGAAALLGKVGMAVTEAATPLATRLLPRVGPAVAEAAGGAVSGGLTGGAESAIAGDDLATVAKKTRQGALIGGVAAPVISAAGNRVMTSPARRQDAVVGELLDGPMQSAKLRKFRPKEEDITKQLAGDKEASNAILDDPKTAPAVIENKLQQVNDQKLEPFYVHAALDKRDGVSPELVRHNLEQLKRHFTESAEKGQRAVIDSVMSDLDGIAERNGGTIPAQVLREEASSYQSQGYGNAPQFSSQPVPLAKKAKQGIGNALRGSVADHLESVYGPDAVAEFRQANKEVSTWIAIKDLATEKMERLKTNSPSMMSVLSGVAGAVKHPIAKMVLPGVQLGAQSIDQNILPQLAESPAAQTIGRGIQQTGPTAGVAQIDMLQRAREEKLRKDREAAGMLYQE